MRLKIFTWNMQRGGAIGQPPHGEQAKYNARRAVLDYLCDWADVGFITEAGRDLVSAVSVSNSPLTNLLPGGAGWWYCSTRADNQAGTNDCKNLLYSKMKLQHKDVIYMSGADDAYRLPATGYFPLVGHPRVLLITLHATSGGGGHENSDRLFDHLDESPGKRFQADVAIVGGDMNCNHRHFMMPGSHTHQSGRTLDGFAFEVYDSSGHEFEVDFDQVEVEDMDGDLELEEHGNNLGCFLNGVRVSDHAPVWGTVNINQIASSESESEDEEPPRKKQKIKA